VDEEEHLIGNRRRGEGQVIDRDAHIALRRDDGLATRRIGVRFAVVVERGHAVELCAERVRVQTWHGNGLQQMAGLVVLDRGFPPWRTRR
jgi:hypothetical protein